MAFSREAGLEEPLMAFDPATKKVKNVEDLNWKRAEVQEEAAVQISVRSS